MNPPLPQKLSILIHPEIQNDYLKLDNSKLEDISYELIEKLASGDIRGQRLENHSIIGDLSKCFKIYFDLNIDTTPGYRIVYTYLPGAKKPKQLIVLAVGARKNLAVYFDAVARLDIIQR